MTVARMRVRIIGAKRSRRELEKSRRRFQPAVEKNLRAAGEIIIGQARREFKGSRTRSLYSISGGKRKRRNPPRPVTSPPRKLGVFEGTYRQSISMDLKDSRRGRSGRRWVAEIGPTVIYAHRHEFGTKGMPQRQVLTPAVKKKQREVFKRIGRSFKVVGI